MLRADVRAVRMLPMLHNYPFRPWTAGRWLEWMVEQRIALWLPVAYEANWHDGAELDPSEVYETVRHSPDLRVVLSEVHYRQFSWALPLLRSLPNVSIEISCFVVVDGVVRLLEAVGPERILFGSRFPDSPMPPQIYHLHNAGLGGADLRAICAGNLGRLLGL